MCVSVCARLEEISQNLATEMLPPGFLVIHNTTAGSKDDVAKLTGGQQIVRPPFDIVHLDVEAGRDDTGLVQATGQIDHHLAAAMIVHDLKLADVTVLHHDGQELDHDLRARSDQHLALAALFRIVDALEGIGQHADTDHVWNLNFGSSVV